MAWPGRAAIAAAEAGADVIVLERSSADRHDNCGGRPFLLGGGTAVQTACGAADSAGSRAI